MHTPSAAHLFDGQGHAFAELASKAKRYGEYGCGESTVWMAQNTGAAIKAVDTSQHWVDTVHTRVGARPNLDITVVDLGPVKDWGWPVSYAHKDRFHHYFSGIWTNDYRPDLVLIDGRFRLACFFTCLLEADPGTTIIFDDYSDRPHYHLAEAVLPRGRMEGRQAIFTVPHILDKTLAQHLRTKFEYVMD